jgi:SAM-dependent methyltransferase
MSAFEGRYRQIVEGGLPGWFAEEHYAELTAHWRDRLTPRIAAGARILEVGCGVGKLAASLVAMGYEVVGVDISETAITLARRSVSDAKFEVANIGSALPFPEGEFDVVLDSDCLHHLHGAARTNFLGESARVLRDAGLLLVKTNVGEPPLEHHEMLGYDPGTRTSWRDGEIVNYYASAEEVLGELEAAGFRLDRVEHSGEANAQLLVDAIRG